MMLVLDPVCFVTLAWKEKREWSACLAWDTPFGCSKSLSKKNPLKESTMLITKQLNEIIKSKNTKSNKTKLFLGRAKT